MNCHSCGRQYADGAAFCPFCGAKPNATAPAAGGHDDEHDVAEKTVALDAADLGIGIGPDDEDDEAEEKTMALDPAALGIEPEAEPEPAADVPSSDVGADEDDDEPEEKTVALDAAALGIDLSQADEDRTVAMQLPPDFFDDDEEDEGDGGEEAGETAADEDARRRSETILGHPGVSVPQPETPAAPAAAPAAPAPASGIDPFGATLESSALDSPLPGKGPGFAPEQPARRPQPPAAPPQAAPAPMSAPGPGAIRGPGSAPPGAQRPPAAPRGGGVPKLALIGGAVGLGVLVLVLVLVFAFSGGGGGGGALQAWIPAKVDSAGAVDLDKLRDSWLYEEFGADLMKVLEEEGDISEFKEETGLEMDAIKAVAFGARAGEKPRFGAVVSGELDRERNEPKLKEELADDKSKRVHEIGDHIFYGKKKSEVAGFLDDSTILMGSSLKMVKSMHKAREEGADVGSDEDLAPVMEAIDTDAALWMVASISDDLMAVMPREARAAGEFIKDGDRVGVSWSVDGDLVLTVVAFFGGDDGADRAEALAEQANDGVAMGKEMLDGMLESMDDDEVPKDELEALAKGALEAVVIEQDGGQLKVVVTLARDLLEPLVDDARKLLKDAL